MTSTSDSLSRRHAALVAGAFLALLVGVATIDAVAHVIAPERWAEMNGTILRRRSGVGFWGGGPARWAEARAEESSTVANVSRPYWSELLYRNLGHTPAPVVAGKDGWFYLKHTLRALADDEARIRRAASAVHAFELVLRAQSIDTVVMLIPSKVTAVPEPLPLGVEAPVPIYDRFLAALRANGTWTIDLLAALGGPSDEPYFRRDDTHWSRSGALRASQAAGVEVRARYPRLEPFQEHRLVWGDELYPAGDLLRLAAFREGGALEESLRTNEYRPEVLMEPWSGLMQVVLTGDSFCVTGALTNFLSLELKTAVANRALAGHGFLHSLASVLERLADRPEHDTRLIVWAFVERQMREPDTINYDVFLRALNRVYRDQVTMVADVTDEAVARSGVATVPCVLPSNGTSCLWLRTDLNHPRRVVVRPDEGRRLDATVEAGLVVEPGPQTTLLALADGGWVGPLAIAMNGPQLVDGELVEASLGTAYRPGVELVVTNPSDENSAVWEIALPEPVVTDGTRALGLRIAGTLPEGGAGRLLGPDGSSLGEPFPLVGGDAGAVYVLPLDDPDQREVVGVRMEIGAGASVRIEAARLLAL